MRNSTLLRNARNTDIAVNIHRFSPAQKALAPFVLRTLVITGTRFHSHITVTTASLGGDSQDLPAPHSRFQFLVLHQGPLRRGVLMEHLPPDGKAIGLARRLSCI
jgi:hypothetical protein